MRGLEKGEQLFGVGLALGAVLDNVEKRFQLLRARDRIKVQDIAVPELVGNIREVLRFGGIDGKQSGGD
jgi:hypothetical protein